MVPAGQARLASLHIGLHVPVPAPVGMTQLKPAPHPAQPSSPLQPEFCVQVAPTAPSPGHAQSDLSPAYTEHASPGAQPALLASVGSQGREHVLKEAVLPHWTGTLQFALLSSQDESLWQNLRQVVTLQPTALTVKH